MARQTQRIASVPVLLTDWQPSHTTSAGSQGVQDTATCCCHAQQNMARANAKQTSVSEVVRVAADD